jgi:hypothetical protein
MQVKKFIVGGMSGINFMAAKIGRQHPAIVYL